MEAMGLNDICLLSAPVGNSLVHIPSLYHEGDTQVSFAAALFSLSQVRHCRTKVLSASHILDSLPYSVQGLPIPGISTFNRQCFSHPS